MHVSDHTGNTYHLTDDNRDFPIEFFNNEWHLVIWQNGQYISSRCCKPTRYGLRSGRWAPTDPAHPEYHSPQISPIEARVTTDQKESSNSEEYRTEGASSPTFLHYQELSLETNILAAHMEPNSHLGKRSPSPLLAWKARLNN